MQWFSDNVSVAFPIRSEGEAPAALVMILTQAAYLHLAFVEEGLFGRGAITRGEFFGDEIFVYGPALERAVVLEHDVARDPRTILDEASFRAAHDASREDGPAGACSLWSRYLAVDDSSRAFVDYLSFGSEDPAGLIGDFDQLLRTHKRAIELALVRFDGCPGVASKYQWLAAYHNDFVDRHGCGSAEVSVFCASPPRRTFRRFGIGADA